MTTTIKPGDIIYVTKELPDKIEKVVVSRVEGSWIWSTESKHGYLLGFDCFVNMDHICVKADFDVEFAIKFTSWLNKNRKPYVSHEKKELERAHKTNRELNRRNQKLESRLIQAEKLLKNSPSNLAFQVWQLQKELTVCKMRLKDDRNIESN